MAAPPGPDEASRLAVLRARLVAPMPDDRPWGWLGPLLVTAFGAFLRFNRLRCRARSIFDETYYAKDAWSILQHGVEWNPVGNANALIMAGHTNIFQPCTGTRLRRVRGAAGGRQAAHRGRRVAVRAELVRLAVLQRGVRLAGHPADLPHRPADDQVHAARLHRRAADVAGRPGVRAVADRDPGHLPDVLRAGRVRLRAHRPGPIPGQARRGRGARARAATRGRGSASASGGWRPGSSSAWPWAPSGSRPGTSSGSARWSSPGTSAPAGRRACLGSSAARSATPCWLPLTFIVDPAGGLRRHLEQLAAHQHRLRPEIRPGARRDHPGHLGPVLAVRVPPAGDQLRPGPDARGIRTSPSPGTGC